MDERGFDLIVVGSGVAGLCAALTAASRARVALVTKGELNDGCSRWAQGGIAAAIGDDDSAQRHYEDTIAAGRGLCDPEAVRVLVEEGPARIRELASWGVAFDTQDGRLLLAQEAAHSRARIVHARGDGTGLEVETALIRRLRASGVAVMEQSQVLALLVDGSGRCGGVDAVDADGLSLRVRAPAVVLASGGAARLWRNSTNPESATGDGISLAFAAGAEVASLEFVQFHPTALALPGAPRFLISEAVRGEGAVVRDGSGRRFLLEHDPRGELAGRDVVSRAIWQELQRSGETCVWLDCGTLGERAALRFPAIHRTCAAYGLNLARDLIPIAPAAHYLIGGVRTDTRGATSLAGLYACGEVASTGVHGANRLASNSLLESIVFGHRAALAALDDTAEMPLPGASAAAPVVVAGSQPRGTSEWEELRHTMWEHAGVVRDADGLRRALDTCSAIAARTEAGASLAERELHAAASTASLVSRAALAREESRGCHLRSDFPVCRDQWHDILVMHKERGDRRVRHA